MLKLQRILCPVDLSEFSAKAYDYAYSLARHYNADLFVQHVTEPVFAMYRGYVSPDLAEEVYSQHNAAIREDVYKLVGRYPSEKIKVEIVIQFGTAADSILSFAEERSIDLITMGTHGRRGLDRLVLGSTLERVLRNARCAVLAVHQPARDFVTPSSPDEPVQLQKILWCTDFSENSPRALEFALSLAFEYNAEITLLHVLEGGGAGQDRRTMELLEQVIPDEARTWLRTVPLVRTGEPYREIIEHASQSQTDLIVMGVRGRNIVDLTIFGSTTHRVIQHGPCPVLAVPT